MSRKWIGSLAEQVKDKGREPAEEYAREQRRAGIIVAEGKVFFMALVQCLEQDLAEIRSRLQGSSVSCETSLVRESPTQVQLHRERFPWFDASLKHHEMEIVLEYARGRGVAGGKTIRAGAERKMVVLAFQVDSQDRVFAASSFDETVGPFEEAEGLARYVLELLFGD